MRAFIQFEFQDECALLLQQGKVMRAVCADIGPPVS
jgi:hypothetical protein